MGEALQYLSFRLRFRCMDALTAVLDGPRANAAFMVKVVLEPPWSLRVQDEAPLAVVVVTRGDVWLVHRALDHPRSRRS